MEGRSEPPQPNELEPALEVLARELTVLPWRDEVVEQLGHNARSMYVEMCWLPVLGPTATWLYRRLGSWAEFNEAGTTVDTIDLSRSLGLGESLAKNSKLNRAIDRLVHFEVARWGGAELQVRTMLPALPERHLRHLGRTSLRLHEEIERRPRTELSDKNGALR